MLRWVTDVLGYQLDVTTVRAWHFGAMGLLWKELSDRGLLG